MILEYFVVFVITLLTGMWGTAAGVFMGLDPVGVYVVTVAASRSFTSIVLFIGGPWRDRFFSRHLPNAQQRIQESRIGATVDRSGIPGLAFGSTIFGPTLTLAAVLVLGLDRRRFLIWYGALTLVGFAVAVAFRVAVAD